MNARLIASLAPAAAIAGPAVLVAGLAALAVIAVVDLFDETPPPLDPTTPKPSPTPAPVPVPARIPTTRVRSDLVPTPSPRPSPALPAPSPRSSAPTEAPAIPRTTTPPSCAPRMPKAAPSTIAPAVAPTTQTGPRRPGKRLCMADLSAALEGGPFPRGEAVARIRKRTGCGQTAAYGALAPGGPFSDSIHEDEDGRLSWRAIAARPA